MIRATIIRSDLCMSETDIMKFAAYFSEIYWIKKIIGGTYMENNNVITQIVVNIQNEIMNGYIHGGCDHNIYKSFSRKNLFEILPKLKTLGLKEDTDYGVVYAKLYSDFVEPEEKDGTNAIGIWIRPLDQDKVIWLTKDYNIYL